MQNVAAEMNVAGFEPLDILAGLVKLREVIHDGRPRVENMYPRAPIRAAGRQRQASKWPTSAPHTEPPEGDGA